MKTEKNKTKWKFTPGWRDLASWKFLLREWYFDIHRLLNGTITFMGQNPYIRVGDNLLVNADILTPSDNYNLLHSELQDNANLLLHVESISHNFAVSSDGARTWTTTVKFVRGLIVDANGFIKAPSTDINQIGAYGALDDRTKENNISSKNKTNIVKTGSSSNPGPTDDGI
jgi:hypothetical protein